MRVPPKEPDPIFLRRQYLCFDPDDEEDPRFLLLLRSAPLSSCLSLAWERELSRVLEYLAVCPLVALPVCAVWVSRRPLELARCG